MHARNRYPGNGYRSNPMVTGGMGIASRVSPESSMRGQGAYGYEYRNFDHGGYGQGQLRPDHGGYGRGQSRPDHGGYGPGQSRPVHAGYGRGQLRPDHGGYGQGQSRPDHGGYGRGQSGADHGGYGQGQSGADHGGYGQGQSRADHGGYGQGQSRPNHGGYGQGQSRQFQRSPQERQVDVFMEAGRLATEYLVSKGLMPPNVLSGKWTSGSFDNQAVADVMQLPFGGRASALSRLGSPVTNVGPGRRRQQDDYNSMSSNNMRDRRRSGSFKNSSPEGSREFRRSGSFSDRSRGSVVAVANKNALSSNRDERKVSNNGGGVSRNRTLELATQKDNGGTLGSSLEKHELINNAGAKASSSREKDLSMPSDVELLQKADEQDSHPEAGEIKDEDDCIVTDQHQIKDDATSQEAGKVESVPSENGGGDLTKLSSFVDVPSKSSSPMAFQELKVVANDITTKADTFQDEPPKESVSCVNNMVVGSFPVDDDSSILQLDHLELPSKEAELLATHDNSHHESPASISEVDESASKEQETNEELPECVMVNSSERGEKRAMSEESPRENKRPKISAASENFHSEGHLRLLDSLEKQPTKEEPMVLGDGAVLLPSNEKRSMDMSLYPKDDIETIMDYTEERPHFPSSFKTFDLNLMEASDMNGNYEKKNIPLFSSETERGKQPVPVNIDLSMSNDFRASSNFGKCSIAGKDIEVIDLENETEQVGRDFNNSERSDRNENVFPCLDGYSNNTHNGNDGSDVQDGYGLMISELLGNDLPSCSSVSTDLSSLHSDMGLHGSENVLGDDDSIYMSLEEIPISFLRVWGQPGQDYSKPF